MNLRKLLPESLSDETAFSLVEFLSQLAATLESHYFVHMRRHMEQMNRQNLRVDQGYDDIEQEDGKPPF